MAQFASADFTGTDSTELSAVDGNWAKISPATGNLTISSNRIIGDAGATAAYYHSASPGTADYSVSCDIIRQSTGTVSGAGVVGRASTGAQTYYHARYNAGQVQLYKFVSGTATLLGTAYTTGTLTVGVAYRLELVMNGTSISAKWDGVTRVGPVTDSAITANGNAGVRFLAGSIPVMDNFSADTFGGGGGGGAPAKAFRIIHG